ncbi:hypothetical protein B0H11DRAFT_1915891 [Mycena galericulata]|nr:hypothetical protein B0H11DRAFT_1915891 [Mycena galericulata]
MCWKADPALRFQMGKSQPSLAHGMARLVTHLLRHFLVQALRIAVSRQTGNKSGGRHRRGNIGAPSAPRTASGEHNLAALPRGCGIKQWVPPITIGFHRSAMPKPPLNPAVFHRTPLDPAGSPPAHQWLPVVLTGPWCSESLVNSVVNRWKPLDSTGHISCPYVCNKTNDSIHPKVTKYSCNTLGGMKWRSNTLEYSPRHSYGPPLKSDGVQWVPLAEEQNDQPLYPGGNHRFLSTVPKLAPAESDECRVVYVVYRAPKKISGGSHRKSLAALGYHWAGIFAPLINDGDTPAGTAPRVLLEVVTSASRGVWRGQPLMAAEPSKASNTMVTTIPLAVEWAGTLWHTTVTWLSEALVPAARENLHGRRVMLPEQSRPLNDQWDAQIWKYCTTLFAGPVLQLKGLITVKFLVKT